MYNIIQIGDVFIRVGRNVVCIDFAKFYLTRFATKKRLVLSISSNKMWCIKMSTNADFFIVKNLI